MNAFSSSEFWSPAEWAAAYHAAGLAVVPAEVSAGRKKPLVNWREFQENGVPAGTHARFYGPNGEHRQTRHMGFLTGRASLGEGNALLVIDVDVKDGKGGLATWHGLLETHNSGIEPETWTAVTGSGGRHFYFRYPAAVEIRNTQETTDGIDVRAQGGFVVAPPSPHYLAGKFYQWADGLAPWETEIAEAPDWLIEWCQSLGEVSFARTDRVKAETTAQPEHVTDAFGNQVDGRDKKMADVAYAAMLDAYRSCPIKPDGAALEKITEAAFTAYMAHTESRLPKDGRSKADRLEAEGRGLTAFREKMRRHHRLWDTHLAKAARSAPRRVLDRKIADAEHGDVDALEVVRTLAKWMAEDGHADARWLAAEVRRIEAIQEPPKAQQPGEQERPSNGKPMLLSSAAFIRSWAPKTFILQDIIEPGRLLTMTGPTGTGKTAIALLLAWHISFGQPIAGRRVRKGRVLFLAGENHDDVKTRWVAMQRLAGVDPDTLEVVFVEGRFGIAEHFDVVRDWFQREHFDLVIIDTLQAFFNGEDSNSNEDMKAFAEVLRRIAGLGAAVLVPAHPVKNASKDRNVPYGGGALLNEVDGNLSLWSDGEIITLHWCGKFRGGFEPIKFTVDNVNVPDAADEYGEPIKTVVARALGALEVDAREQEADAAVTKLLIALAEHPGSSVRALTSLFPAAKHGAGWSRGSVHNRLHSMKRAGLVDLTLDKWTLTPKGKRHVAGH